MSNTTKHNTALLPLSIASDGYIVDAGGSAVCETLRPDYRTEGEILELRSLIVRAVNAHDGLVEALENLLWKANQKQPLSNDDKNSASAALAKARGSSSGGK